MEVAAGGAIVYMVETSTEHVPGSCVVGLQLQVGIALRTTVVASGVGVNTPPRMPVANKASRADEVFMVTIVLRLEE